MSSHKPDRSRYLFTRYDMTQVLAVTAKKLTLSIKAGTVPPPTCFVTGDQDPRERRFRRYDRWSRQDILAWMWCGMPTADQWVELKARLRREMLDAGVAPPWSPEAKDLKDLGAPADQPALEEYLERLSGAISDLALRKVVKALVKKGALEEEHDGPPVEGDEDLNLMPPMPIGLPDPTGDAE